jgi:hypothetical protein
LGVIREVIRKLDFMAKYIGISCFRNMQKMQLVDDANELTVVLSFGPAIYDTNVLPPRMQQKERFRYV